MDWTRGAAAFVMLQGHTFHSFTRSDLRARGPYMLSQFVGGLPPAVFLFLTGLTFALLMHSQERKQLSGGARIIGALKRARYLFILAFLFRLQLYVFGYPTSPASELLRVDVLNCMGFSMLVLSPMAVFSTAERARLCAVLGLAIAFLAPGLDLLHPNLPAPIAGYIFPSYTAFSFFPWAAFLAFGMSMGSILRLVKPEDTDRVMLWTLGVGLLTITAAHYFSSLPYSLYERVDYWLDGPGLTTMKLGIVLVVLAAGYLWVGRSASESLGLFRLFGTSSLLVYWVHIELVYGRWFGVWKEKLSYTGVLVYTSCLVLLMWGLSIWSKRLAANRSSGVWREWRTAALRLTQRQSS